MIKENKCRRGLSDSLKQKISKHPYRPLNFHPLYIITVHCPKTTSIFHIPTSTTNNYFNPSFRFHYPRLIENIVHFFLSIINFVHGTRNNVQLTFIFVHSPFNRYRPPSTPNLPLNHVVVALDGAKKRRPCDLIQCQQSNRFILATKYFSNCKSIVIATTAITNLLIPAIFCAAFPETIRHLKSVKVVIFRIKCPPERHSDVDNPITSQMPAEIFLRFFVSFLYRPLQNDLHYYFPTATLSLSKKSISLRSRCKLIKKVLINF